MAPLVTAGPFCWCTGRKSAKRFHIVARCAVRVSVDSVCRETLATQIRWVGVVRRRQGARQYHARAGVEQRRRNETAGCRGVMGRLAGPRRSHRVARR